MNNKPDILDRVFDLLSSFSYLDLRRFFERLWGFSTIIMGLALLLEGLAFYNGTVDLNPNYMKNLYMWLGFNPIFGYMFYRWKQRTVERASITK